jgi:hypothetical protein
MTLVGLAVGQEKPDPKGYAQIGKIIYDRNYFSEQTALQSFTGSTMVIVPFQLSTRKNTWRHYSNSPAFLFRQLAWVNNGKIVHHHGYI